MEVARARGKKMRAGEKKRAGKNPSGAQLRKGGGEQKSAEE